MFLAYCNITSNCNKSYAMNFIGHVGKLGMENLSENLSAWAKAMAGEWQSCDSNPKAPGIKVHLLGPIRTTKSNTLGDSRLCSSPSPDPDLNSHGPRSQNPRANQYVLTRASMWPRSGSTRNHSHAVNGCVLELNDQVECVLQSFWHMESPIL